MNGLDEKISALLSSPDGMEKIMQVARSLTSGEEKKDETPARTQEEEKNDMPDISKILSALGGGKGEGGLSSIDPKLLTLAMDVMGAYSESDDEKIKLFSALRPYLRADRRDRIDKTMQALKLAKVAKRAMGSLGGGDRLV